MSEDNYISKLFIGVDVSKEHVDIYIHPTGESFKIRNKAIHLARWISHYCPAGSMVIYEATGGYERVLCKVLQKRNDIIAKRIHPHQVKSYSRAFGIQAKTDSIDAKMIARAAQQLGDALYDTSVDDTTQKLRDILARRQQLQDILHGEQCRLKRDEHNKIVIKDLKSNIKQLIKRIESMEQHAREIINDNDRLRKQSIRLQTVKGVGEKVALTIIAYLPEIGKLDRKKIAAMAGLAPFTQQSGALKSRAYTKGGRQMLKKALYMAALVGIRYNNVLKEFYQSLLDKRKPKMVALIATARKLLLHMNAIEKKALNFKQDGR